jgi:hypothetical protein
MITIRKEQLDGLELAIRNSESEWAMNCLRGQHASWCAQRNPAEVQQICSDTLAFADLYSFHSKPSLQCLLELRVTGRWPEPFSAWQKLLLTRKGFPEETRLAQFLETLSGADQRVLIALGSDLNATS